MTSLQDFFVEFFFNLEAINIDVFNPIMVDKIMCNVNS